MKSSLKLATPKAAPPPGPAAAPSYKPSPHDILALSWFGGRVDAAAFRKGTAISPILTREPGSQVASFLECLDEIVTELGFIGNRAMALLDGGILETSNLTLPPASKRKQDAYLREKAKRGDLVPGTSIWESQRIVDAKSGPKALLHSVSKTHFNQLSQGLASHGISLKKALPFLGIATLPFRRLPFPEDATTITIAPAGAGYKILGLDPRGELQFARDLNGENSRDSQRAAIEINRCLLFARQNFGNPVGQIVLVGHDAQRFEASVKDLLKGEIPILRRPGPPGLWLRQLATANCFNLAKESMIQDRKRRLQQGLALAASLTLGTFMLGYAAKTQLAWRDATHTIQALLGNEAAMQQRIQEFQLLAEEIQAQRLALQQLEDIGRAPIERALLAHLAAKLPQDTWVTELETHWQPIESRWHVRLSLGTDSDPAQRRKPVETALEQAPISLRIDSSPLQAMRSISVQSDAESSRNLFVEGYIHAPNAPQANEI